MTHPAGERLRCDECGAEIMFMNACSCPGKEPKSHSDICCGKEMRSLGVGTTTEPTQPAASH